MDQVRAKGVRDVSRVGERPGEHRPDDRGRGRKGGHRETAEGLGFRRVSDCHSAPDRCLASGLRHRASRTDLGGTRFSEKVEDSDQDTEARDRSDRETTGPTETGRIDMSESEFELIEGSGNIFRDFGDPESDLKHAKAVVAARIIATLDERGLSVRKAGTLTGFAPADFSRVRNADLGRFTLDRLMKMLGALDKELEIAVRIHARGQNEPTMVG